MSNTFSSDLSGPSVPFHHYWEHTVGSGHASLGLRADWQQQLRRCHDELGFKHVRFHGILCDDMGTLMKENDKLVYSFFNADQVCDYILSIGMVPFMELSFMPSALSSGDDTVFHYRSNITPPRNYDDWELLIYNLVQHWSERYGIEQIRQWFFEIWNEPNLSAFWTGTRQEYFSLYRHAVHAIKRVDDDLKVGGPATAANAWIEEFRNYCDTNKVPYDFISTHHYPTDAFGKPGDDTLSQLAASKRSVLRDQVIDTRRRAGDTPVYYTEWCTSSNPFDELHDLPYAAAFITKTIMEGANEVQGYSYWTFSDIFEENYFASVPFHGGFGLVTVQGVPKPSYRAFQLLHKLGDKIYRIEGTHATVDIWMAGGEKCFHVLITNSALPRHSIMNETIQLAVKCSENVTNSYIERIDEAHANAKVAWLDLGSPSTLSVEQILSLEQSSSLVREPFYFEKMKDSLIIKVDMPVQGTALITFEVE